MSSSVGMDVYGGGVGPVIGYPSPDRGRLQPPWEAVLVNEFAPAKAMVGIADKSAPTRRSNLRPYRWSGFIRETKAGVPSFPRYTDQRCDVNLRCSAPLSSSSI